MRLSEGLADGVDKGITVPALLDVPSGWVATNDFAQMALDFATE
jgi:putative glutathione S-transferase